jgi:uncharacterized membrane protein HdeD (DUF308 family)
MLAELARHWWVFLVRGIFAVLFGLAAFFWPGLTLWALVILYGAYAIADGVAALVFGFGTRGHGFWPMLLFGLLGIGAGIVAFAWPGITALALLYLIAAWSVVRGVFEIATAIRLRKAIENEWLLGLAGVMSILFGIALAVWPGAGLLALVWLIGAAAFVIGLSLIALAFRLRSLSHRVGRPSDAGIAGA